MKYILGFEGEYGFLSNFYPSPISVAFHEYPTVEHAYQTFKTLDEGWRTKIRAAATPGLAKKLGRQAPLNPEFEELKIRIMRMLLRKKFAPGSDFAQKLLETIGYELEETNWWGDEFWGVSNGIGLNALGRLLMEIRADLAASEGWLPAP